MSYVIFNADDFGRSKEINDAVAMAYEKGVLTSASLVVTGDAFSDAVEIAKELGLDVGIHIVLALGRAASHPSSIPHIAGRDGSLPSSPAKAGFLYFLDPRARREIALEIEEQFRIFESTGLRMDHVNGHTNLDMHPNVFPIVLRLAEGYGAKGIRIPRDELLLSLYHDRRNFGSKIGWALAFSILCRAALRRLKGSSLKYTDRVYGLFQAGAMREGYVLSILDRMKAFSAEIYLHPSMVESGERYGPNPGDLRTLLSPRVKEALEERGIRLCSYSSLPERGERIWNSLKYA
jgi:hopanoid biosynthesis associated protein HpnK